MSSAGKNDRAWEKLFDKYDILRQVEANGLFKISADQIKEFREPRLMVKFDHSVNLPELFAKNQLAILPITRGDYVISHFDAYHRFEGNNSRIKQVSLPSYIQSLDCKDIPSEAIALNCAVASGIIADFMEDSEIVSTVSGRMGSGDFSFRIGDVKNGGKLPVIVHNSQIEIDAAYEGTASLALFEAKRDLSDDFLVRQLYYPFRVWDNRIKKPVRPIFLIYTNGVYRLYEYAFEDKLNYNSLRLVRQLNYSLDDTAISEADIRNVLEKAGKRAVKEPEIPFPQADDFGRVINVCELVSAHELSRSEVTEQYSFDARQTNYYTDAARYLGLLEKRTKDGVPVYSISKEGKKLLAKSYKDRQLALCQCILSHKAFKDTLKFYFKNGVMPSTDDIVAIMEKSHLYRVDSDATYRRRASTVRSWVNWILSLFSPAC